MHARATPSSPPPSAHGSVSDTLMICVRACFDCAQSCTSCADACLDERGVAGLSQCIRLTLVVPTPAPPLARFLFAAPTPTLP